MSDLHPETAAFLAQLAAAGAPPLETQSVEEARAAYAAGATVVAGPAGDVAAVDSELVGGVPCEVVRPHGWAPGGPTVLYLHGGGWVVGSPATYRHVTTSLAERTGAQVVVPDYRLAPEHPHPAAQEDVRAVLAALPAGGRLAVAGDSAGGHIAAWLARQAPTRFVAQALVYPAVHPRLDTPSALADDGRTSLSRPGMRWYWDHYLAGTDPSDPAVDLLARTDDLLGLPPALVAVAGHDVLRDEGVAYAEALRAEGVPVELREWPGHVHGFLRTSAVTPEGAGELLDALAEFLRPHLA